MIIWVKTEKHFKRIFGDVTKLTKSISLWDVYRNPSREKIIAYSKIISITNGAQLIVTRGNKHSFSVTVKGLHYWQKYTKDNLYIYFIKN